MHRIRSWARSRASASGFNPFTSDAQQPAIPLQDTVPARTDGPASNHGARGRSRRQRRAGNVETDAVRGEEPTTSSEQQKTTTTVEVHGWKLKTLPRRFYVTSRMIILSSWLNALLVFVPVGIILRFLHAPPTAVFTVNALAIIPLAGLLSYATEGVARKMGDTVGALMNVTFGNAVELIIYVIALVKNEIRIVQASLLGSILENLLLILGMCFLFGGLRFREQIYNSTVTQMSACLLSLSVTSLLLPTAFHASFTNQQQADRAVLKVSRGTSIILLVIYVIYILFQLKSHAFLYQSTPQERIDEESHPGLLANIMGSSSSSSTSDSSNSSDSDSSSSSDTTAGRLRRVVMGKGRRRRKSSVSSRNPSVVASPRRQGSEASGSANVENTPTLVLNSPSEGSIARVPELAAIASGDEADVDKEVRRERKRQEKVVNFDEMATADRDGDRRATKEKRKKKKQRRSERAAQRAGSASSEKIKGAGKGVVAAPFGRASEATLAPPSASTTDGSEDKPQPPSPRLSLSLRNFALRPVIPKPPSTEQHGEEQRQPHTVPPPAPSRLNLPYVVRRATSLPDRLNRSDGAPFSPVPLPPPFRPVNVSHESLDSKNGRGEKAHISRLAAVILLCVSTALVAMCAEFLVGSINELVADTGLSAAFVGLIILPIVSNAAEHITAVTVASKNKMDLAIGVAVGSSIQIALFVTPVIMLLGWILSKEISLYFTIFETISLFVSAFIVNYLVLDGRSNYLEGTLLIAAYIIIALAAFFYPDSEDQSPIGGGP